MLIVGRAIAGSGSSGILNGSMTMISAATPLAKRPCEFILLSLVDMTNFFQSSHGICYVFWNAGTGNWSTGWGSLNTTCYLEMVSVFLPKPQK